MSQDHHNPAVCYGNLSAPLLWSGYNAPIILRVRVRVAAVAISLGAAGRFRCGWGFAGCFTISIIFLLASIAAITPNY